MLTGVDNVRTTYSCLVILGCVYVIAVRCSPQGRVDTNLVNVEKYNITHKLLESLKETEIKHACSLSMHI